MCPIPPPATKDLLTASQGSPKALIGPVETTPAEDDCFSGHRAKPSENISPKDEALCRLFIAACYHQWSELKRECLGRA